MRGSHPLLTPRSPLSTSAGRAGLLALLAMVLLVLALSPGPSRAEVYHSKESALRLAFPGADRVDREEIFLSRAQAQRAESLSKTRLPSRMITVYAGHKDGELMGFAFIETHKVRSLPETILVVVDADGLTSAVHMLAFHEPPEYAPPPAWLGQFADQELDDELRLRGDIAGIAGGTLTATAVTAAVRRILAVHEVGVAPRFATAPKGESGLAAAGR